ncbi:MAG: hypothetical protein J6L90_00810 [Clostridia bacterium]|nr:hypothetical protein [Clostridia bacterium]
MERGKARAERYYEEIRRRVDDVPAIAKNTGIPASVIQDIKIIFLSMNMTWQRGKVGLCPIVIWLAHGKVL